MCEKANVLTEIILRRLHVLKDQKRSTVSDGFMKDNPYLHKTELHLQLLSLLSCETKTM